MTQHDLIIRNGQIIEGIGAPALSADIAVTNGKISALGSQIDARRLALDVGDLSGVSRFCR